jgi:hypothetical protein
MSRVSEGLRVDLQQLDHGNGVSLELRRPSSMGRHVSGEVQDEEAQRIARGMARVIQPAEETSKWTEETEEVFRSIVLWYS